jgi:two-component system, NarL family, nitrate/nitrite response regulator NarL
LGFYLTNGPGARLYDSNLEERVVTRLFAFTDEPVLASGLEVVLKPRIEFELVATCGQAFRIAENVAADKPDILLIDMTQEVTFKLLLELQRLSPGTRIALWVNSIRAEMAYQAIEHGIRGILRKTLSPEAFVAGLRIVAAGGIWFDEALEAELRAVRSVHLTPRESQLVGLLTSGLKNKEIATAMFLCEGTVKVYLSKLFQKLRVKDRFELALFGLMNSAGTEGANGTEQRSLTQPKKRSAGREPFIHHLAMGRLALVRPLDSRLAPDLHH